MLHRFMIHDWWIININSPVWEIWKKFVQFMSDFVNEIIPKSSDESVDTIMKNSSMSEAHFIWCSPNMKNWDFVVTFLWFRMIPFSLKSLSMTHNLWLIKPIPESAQYNFAFFISRSKTGGESKIGISFCGASGFGPPWQNAPRVAPIWAIKLKIF